MIAFSAIFYTEKKNLCQNVRRFAIYALACNVQSIPFPPSLPPPPSAPPPRGMIRCFSSSGEASANEDYHWLCAFAGYKPIIEYCGGAEVGGAFLSGTMLQPSVLCTFTTPTIGARIALIGTDGQQSVRCAGDAPICSCVCRLQTYSMHPSYSSPSLPNSVQAAA